jgi:hypothetical protein
MIDGRGVFRWIRHPITGGRHTKLINSEERIFMKRTMLLLLVVWTSVLLAQDNNLSSRASQEQTKRSKGEITVRGCVSMLNGDFILVKQDPAMTYELQSAHKIKLGRYLGQRVEVTGRKSPSLDTSSDVMDSDRDASSLTLTITSIKTVTKECTEDPVSNE